MLYSNAGTDVAEQLAEGNVNTMCLMILAAGQVCTNSDSRLLCDCRTGKAWSTAGQNLLQQHLLSAICTQGVFSRFVRVQYRYV